MALGLPSGGDFNPYINWAATDQAFKIKGEDGGTVEIEIDEVVIDFENLKRGHGLMKEGSPPEWVWYDDLALDAPFPDKPDDRAWKPGVCVQFFMGGEDLYDMSTNASGALIGIDEAHDKYLAGSDANKGKVAVFKYTGNRGIRIGKGNSRVPEFDLVKWIDRPAELEVEESEGEANSNAAPAEAPKKAAGGSQF